MLKRGENMCIKDSVTKGLESKKVKKSVGNFLSYYLLSKMCVSGIKASQICQWWFDFKLEPIFDTGPAASKSEACFKSGQSRLENNHLAT